MAIKLFYEYIYYKFRFKIIVIYCLNKYQIIEYLSSIKEIIIPKPKEINEFLSLKKRLAISEVDCYVYLFNFKLVVDLVKNFNTLQVHKG